MGGPVHACVFSPDGGHFASGGDDEMVMVWRTNFDREIADTTLARSTKGCGGNDTGTSSQVSAANYDVPSEELAAIEESIKPRVSTAPESPLRRSVPPSAPTLLPGAPPPTQAPPAPVDKALPETVASTLQHMVNQLAVISQTMALLEERVTMTENKIKGIENNLPL